MSISSGMNYAPKGKPSPVCKAGDFYFSAIGLDHGHIYGMCNGLIEAGGVLKSVWDSDPKRLADFKKTYPQVELAKSEDEILTDKKVHLVAGAAITSQRCALGLRVMSAGKDYFTDKAPFTTLEQLALAKAKVLSTGRKYMVYYGERLHNEGALYAGQLIESGTIGRVLQITGIGPHRLNAAGRPAWFFEREHFGGILCDIGSHQIEQYLAFANVSDAQVVRSQIANYNNPYYPEFEDFGDVMLVGNNGSTGYFRVDWFTPQGLGSWGDGRAIILGTEGYIEVRKYIDIARSASCDNVYLVDQKGEHLFSVTGQIGFPFFGQLILDCLNRSEHAMTQTHAFKVAELCLQAQAQAVRIC